jgi:putative ABC transport system permease protein
MRAGIAQEIVQMAVDSIRSHKLRSILTLLGITIGVMTVIAMVSVIQGLNETFLGELESAGSDLIIVSKFEPGIQIGNLSEEERQKKDLTLEDVDAIEAECPAVRSVAVDLAVDFFESIAVKYQSTKTLDPFILGMNAHWPKVITIYNAQEGRFISEADVAHRAKICVLGAEVNETLFPHTNALGKDIRIGSEKFRVVGILEKRGSMFGQSRDNIVGIPITTLMKHFPYDLANLEILASPVERSLYDEATEQSWSSSHPSACWWAASES